MTIQRYIYNLRKQIRETTDATEREALNFKMRYAIAYRQGADALKALRDRLIEREIGKTYSEGAQIAILFNRETHPDEYEAYQAFRITCKNSVDVMLESLKKEIMEVI
jgi:hypothetical protein